MNKKSKSTDATGSQKGNIYQYVYVIELLLNSTDDTTIYVETYGDVSDGNISTELKHKIKPISLGDKHIDLWKTIYNRLEGYDQYVKFDKLVLYTTAFLPEDSHLIEWNQKNRDEKYKTLNDIVGTGITKTVEKEIKKFLNFDTEKAKNILDKVCISAENDNLEEKVQNIVKKGTFRNVKNKDNRKQLFLDIMGIFMGFYILKNDISSKEFMEIVRPKILQYIEFEHVLSPYSFKTSVVLSKYKNERFIKELQEIGIPDSSQERDIRDYSYANNNHFELLRNTSLIHEIGKFRDELLDNLGRLKDKHGRNKSSYDLYYDSTDLRLITNPYFENNRYFQNGNIHINVNDNNFTWLYKKNGETSDDS